jgi:hypothetical protein
MVAPVDMTNQDGFGDLAGNPSAESQQLNAILKAKSINNGNAASDALSSPDYASPVKTDSLPGNNNQRIVDDKKLNNFLMQAQKII